MTQAAEVAARILTDEEVYSFVDLHAEALLECHAVKEVCALFERVPLARVMGDARLLLAWSDALLDIDEFEQALARAKAGRLLAGHAEQMELSQHGLANLSTPYDCSIGGTKRLRLFLTGGSRRGSAVHLQSSASLRSGQALRDGWQVRRGK